MTWATAVAPWSNKGFRQERLKKNGKRFTGKKWCDTTGQDVNQKQARGLASHWTTSSQNKHLQDCLSALYGNEKVSMFYQTEGVYVTKNVFPFTQGRFSGKWQNCNGNSPFRIYRSHGIISVCHMVRRVIQDASKWVANMKRHVWKCEIEINLLEINIKLPKLRRLWTSVAMFVIACECVNVATS